MFSPVNVVGQYIIVDPELESKVNVEKMEVKKVAQLCIALTKPRKHVPSSMQVEKKNFQGKIKKLVTRFLAVNVVGQDIIVDSLLELKVGGHKLRVIEFCLPLQCVNKI